MRITQATKLRTKTVLLRTIDALLTHGHRHVARQASLALHNPDPALRLAELAAAAEAHERVQALRQDCAAVIVSHRFDIAMFNEGLTRAATPTRAD